MTEGIALMVAGLLAIAVAEVVAARTRTAAPILLVVGGVVVGLLPVVPDMSIDPDIVLVGLLPPLLYASAVSMPAVRFRRELGAIVGLSVPLVVISSLAVGAVVTRLIPGEGLAWGIALGAVVSPTDAVATSVIRGGRVPTRVISILQGESLLNDATALVILHTAVLASAAGFSFWAAAGSFLYSVVVSVAIGAVIGWANVAFRQRLKNSTVSTAVSFTVPFLASVPAEAIGASGLVAAVIAGLLTGFLAPRRLSPQHRLSDAQNWASVAFVLEGAVFLLMGLQLSGILHAVERESIGVVRACAVGLAVLGAALVVRAAYVAPLLWTVSWRGRRQQARQSRLVAAGDKEFQGTRAGDGRTWGDLRPGPLDGPASSHCPAWWSDAPRSGGRAELAARRAARESGMRDRRRVLRRLEQVAADIGYFVHHPLGAREGAVIVWAGLRGAVTVAAVQTLPPEAQLRPLLVFVAFVVAMVSLIVQGGTVQILVKALYRHKGSDDVEDEARREDAERQKVRTMLDAAASTVPRQPGQSATSHRLAVLRRQRGVLLDMRDVGAADADVLTESLRSVDADEIALELRDEPEG